MPKMTGAQFLAEAINGYGVTHVFFVPTILSHTLFELEKRTQIKRIMTHGEKTAVYMADGFTRASGKPVVCMAQTVGAANLAAGLRESFLACTPVIAFTGGPYEHTRSRHTYQEIKDFPLFEPVTKFNAVIERIDRLPDLLRQAFRVATTGTPGPVHLQFEGHQGEIEMEESDLEVIVEKQFARAPAFRPAADPAAVQETAKLLADARRPVIVVGGGIHASGAQGELVELAEKLSIPVATSLNAKDTIAGNHPLSVGVVGLYCRKSANRAVLEADLVFYVGSRTGSQVTFNWKVPPVGTPVIQLDINPEELGRHYPNKVSLLGDAKVVLRQVIGAAEANSTSLRSEWVGRTQTLVQNWREEFGPLLDSEDVPMRPERLCRDLSIHLPPDALLVADTGHSGMWTGGMVDLKKPGQGFIRAAGSLGWGFPAALGAKLALPNRPVVLFTGDGGFWYHLSELETAARWNINLVVLVNNNRSLNQEIGPYTKAYGKLHGRHHELWQFNEVDFAKVAESLGAFGVRVNKPQELPGALEQALGAGKPAVVDVVTEITAMAPRAFVYE